jgi:enoyl-CoA hydratase/carnithine racemase
MSFAEATIDQDNAVAVVTLAYGEDNALNPKLLDALSSQLDALEANDDVRAVVITGAGSKHFSTGLDLPWLMTKVSEPQTVGAYLLTLNKVYERLTLFPKPTVGALNGHTFAGGAFLAAHLDFRIMREDRGWICLPEVDINIPLLPGMIAICEAVMPPPAFRKLYYTGARVGAVEGKAMGFIDEVAPLDELLPKAVAFAAMLGKKKTATYAEMKRRIREPVAKLLRDEDPKLFATTLSFAL